MTNMTWKRFGIVLICAGLTFYFVGRFTFWQAVLLALVFAFLAAGIADTSNKSRPFARHFVQIYPKWHYILPDYFGIVTEEDRERFRSKLPETSNNGYDPIEDALMFTALEDELYFWNNVKCYSSEVMFRADIPALDVKTEPLDDLFCAAEFFVKESAGGYSIGVVTRESWNRSLKHHGGEDKPDIEIAKLPYSVFWDYRGPVTHKAVETRAKELLDQGWTEKDLSNPEMPSPYTPECLEHKYFTVHHRYI